MAIEQSLASSRRVVLIWLGVVLLLGLSTRLYELTRQAYVLDEDWSLEIATGRGSMHLNVPLDRVVAAPAFYSLTDAPPWWHIWTHMEVTHPPLYSILLRWWIDLCGDSDYSGRLFSVLASVMAIGLLFDTVRLQAGLRSAVWAGLLMVVSSPQLEHARLTRSYTLLLAVSLIAVNIITRIQQFGMTRQRWVILIAAVLSTLMTHYFCLGAILGLLMYAMWKIPGQRRKIMLGFVIAGVIFVVVWGPWMWQQRHLFATDDRSTTFLTSDASDHFSNTVLRVLLAPVRLLYPEEGGGIGGIVAMLCGVALCIIPFLPALYRKNPYLLLWGLWLTCGIGVITLLDLGRGTSHLLFVRYTIIAGPAVFALIPSLFASLPRWRGVLHLVCGLVVLQCIGYMPDLYNRQNIDARGLVNSLIQKPQAGDILMIAAVPEQTSVCEIQMLLLARYLQPMNCSIAILTHKASPEMIQTARQSRLVFLDMQEADYRAYLPGAQLLGRQTSHGLGNVFTLQVGSDRALP